MISRGQKILKLLMDKDKYTTPAFSAATVSGCDNNELNIEANFITRKDCVTTSSENNSDNDKKSGNYNMVQNCSSKESEINLVKTNQSCWEKESVTSQFQSDLEENDDSDDVDYIPETDYSDDSILGNCCNEELHQKQTQNHSIDVDYSAVSPMVEQVPMITVQLGKEASQEIQSNVVTSPSEAESTAKKKKRRYKNVRHKDFCYFCESEIQNFARHVLRNHKGETDVQKILLMNTNSIERKRAIAVLRKKGNFIKNSITFYKPVHKSYINDTEDNYINCPFCLGFYSRKRLWKHKKECTQKKDNHINGSEIHNLLANKYETDFNLKTRVFPRMITDKISLTVQKDPLICSFGSRYLNSHREQHHINVCSRKMRELGKVLIECKKIKPQIQNSFQLLHPQMFDVIVQSVKVIGKYDPQKDIFMSPTFAMNISRSLKDLCNIAIHHIVKRKYNYLNLSAAEAEANVNTFRNMIENTWKYEISSQAGHDSNTKTWNKVTLVPLAADLKLFRTYLIEKGNHAAKQLKIDKKLNSYMLLMETAFCRLLLLNRRRVGELQRLKLSTYNLVNENSRQNYEEFAEAVTSTEQVLLKKFKRIVTRGKRGRGVPILFSTDLQEHIKLLVQFRHTFLKKENSFLFANPNSDQAIVGYKVIQKHARLSGAKNPDALTSTKLRKHLATLTQIFNMTPVEVEQLATFMGHSTDVHKQVYRLPDDIYQTAKIAKILMLMEKGEAAIHKGKTLDEIDVNLDEEIQEEDEDVEENIQNNLVNIVTEGTSKDTEEGSEKPVNTIKQKIKKRILQPWTNEQKQIVLDFFENQIKTKKPPKRAECEALKDMHPKELQNKDWLKIKVFVQNVYTNKTKSRL